MLTEYYNQLTEMHKGILFMFTGFILLAYQLDWAFLSGLRELISLVLTVASIALIGYGFYKLDGPAKIMAFFDKKP